MTAARLPLVAAALLLAAPPAAAQRAWPRSTAEGHDPIDRGTGLVSFAAAPGEGRADTLVVRAAPAADAPVVALFLLGAEGQHGWSYAVAAPDSLRPNLLEYDYEIAGLPTDSMLARDGGRWARVLVGARQGAMVRGWVALDGTRTVHLDWAEYLPTREGLFALAPARTVFARAPGGARVPSPFSRRHAADDHWLEVRERRGAWLRVRFLQPAGACGDEPPADQVVRTLWVRFLDARGRPAVWYYTRGC